MPVEKIVEELNKLSVLELVELKKSLEEAWDVSAAAAAPVMVAAPAGGGGGGGGGEQEEQSSFDVVLTGTGDKKIQVIKVIRELTGLGLKEAKAVADEAPAHPVANAGDRHVLLEQRHGEELVVRHRERTIDHPS